MSVIKVDISVGYLLIRIRIGYTLVPHRPTVQIYFYQIYTCFLDDITVLLTNLPTKSKVRLLLFFFFFFFLSFL